MPRAGRFIATFGNGQHGRLGHGARCASELFARVVSGVGRDVKQVACGGAHTAVVTDSGSLYTFGINNHGQLGHSDDLKHAATPAEAILPDSVASVAASESHTLCLSTSGEVWACGSNGDAQLGLGPLPGVRNADFRLVRALAGVKVAQVAAGHQHSLALTESGEVYAWGHGGYGALGLGPGRTRWEPLPLRVAALEGVAVKHVAAGAFHSGCVDADGEVYVWGHGGYWQLGLGINAHECYPQQLQRLRLQACLALGFSHSISVGNFGGACTWGTDEQGSLGQGFLWPRPGSRTPQRLRLELTGAAAGWKHSLGVNSDGRLFTWGWGGAVGAGGLLDPHHDLGAGQLGHGDDADCHEPRQVMRLMHGRNQYLDLRQTSGPGARGWRALQVSAGRNHSAAVVEAELADHELD